MFIFLAIALFYYNRYPSRKMSVN